MGIRPPLRIVLASLPLMGIGNSSVSFRSMVRVSSLITPHGDREPGPGALAAGDRELITPHGDRELTGSPGTINHSRTHYPSWGSGTSPAAAAPRRSGSLITPHGDREPVVVDQLVAVDELITPHGDRELCHLLASLGAHRLCRHSHARRRSAESALETRPTEGLPLRRTPVRAPTSPAHASHDPLGSSDHPAQPCEAS